MIFRGWRASNCRSPASSLASSQNPLKQKIEVLNSSSSSSMVSSTKQNSAWHDDAVTAPKISESRSVVQMDGRSRILEPLKHKHSNGRDHPTKVSDMSSGSALDVDHSSGSPWDDDTTTAKIPEGKHIVHVNGRFSNNDTSTPSSVTSVSDKPPEIVLDEACHSAWDDDTVLTSTIPEEKQIVHDDRIKSSDMLYHVTGLSRTSTSDITPKVLPDAVHTSGVSSSSSSSQLYLQHENSDSGITASTVNTDSVNITYSGGAAHESSTCLDELTLASAVVNGNTESLHLGLSSVNLDNQLSIDNINMGQRQSSVSDNRLVGNFGNLDSRLQQQYPENGPECVTSIPMINSSIIPDAHVSGKLSDWRLGLQKQVLSSSGNVIEDALAANDDQRQILSTATNLSSLSSYKTYSSNLTSSSQNSEVDDKRFSADGDFRIMGAKMNRDHEPLFLNGHKEEIPSSFVKSERVFEYPNITYTEKEMCSSGFDNISDIERTANADEEEENIVSKMLSPDFDPWDNSWSSANNFAKLLAQMNNNQEGSSKQSSSWKPQNPNQSRFSFARQENQANLGDSSYQDISAAQQVVSSKQDLYGNFVGNAFSISNFERANVLGSSSTNSLSDGTAGQSLLDVNFLAFVWAY